MKINPLIEAVWDVAGERFLPEQQQPYAKVIDECFTRVVGDTQPGGVWGYCHMIAQINGISTGVFYIADPVMPYQSDTSEKFFGKPFPEVPLTSYNFYRMYLSAVGMLLPAPPEKWCLVQTQWPEPVMMTFEPATIAGGFIIRRAAQIAQKKMTETPMDFEIKAPSFIQENIF